MSEARKEAHDIVQRCRRDYETGGEKGSYVAIGYESMVSEVEALLARMTVKPTDVRFGPEERLDVLRVALTTAEGTLFTLLEHPTLMVSGHAKEKLTWLREVIKRALLSEAGMLPGS
jgi:hypothetical protein